MGWIRTIKRMIESRRQNVELGNELQNMTAEDWRKVEESKEYAIFEETIKEVEEEERFRKEHGLPPVEGISDKAMAKVKRGYALKYWDKILLRKAKELLGLSKHIRKV